MKHLFSLVLFSQIFPSNCHALPASAAALAVVKNLGGSSRCEELNGGFHCFITINSKTVDVIVPRDFAPSGECLVHFHGLRFRSVEDKTPQSTVKYFNFEVGLNRYSPEALMIVPVGAFGRSNYTLAADYGTLSKLEVLTSAVESLSKQNCQSIDLSGHSAAYRVITPLLQEIKSKKTKAIGQKVKNVFMFDALYSSNVAPFGSWVSLATDHFLYNVSLPGGDTRANSLRIPSSPRYSNFQSTISDHWNLVRDKYFSQFLQSSRRLKTRIL